MALITWSNEYSVKIDSVDKQHIKIVELINKLHDALQVGDSKSVLEEILSDLADYTAKHFKFEENLFDKYGYEETQAHKKEHNDLIKQVNDLKKSYEEQTNFMIGVEVMVFLKNWLIDHIMGTDMKYSPFLIEKGVK